MILINKTIIMFLISSIYYVSFAQTSIYEITNNKVCYHNSQSKNLKQALNETEAEEINIDRINSYYKPTMKYYKTVANVIDDGYIKIGKTFQI